MPEPSYTASRTLVNDDIDDPEPPQLPDALGDEEEDTIKVTDSVDDTEQEEEELQHYLTPETTPERNFEECMTETSVQATDSQATRAGEISADFDAQNILSSRTRGAKRREAYATALTHPSDLSAYYSAFSVGLSSSKEHSPD
ncbi:hypothetical protein EPUS_07982 [Endocarpon pusillum Z07020]|uniref:Uncharacterized protein n=1 Tax=Endocarpon pusillum (strain Z07020 / HMAS-L-300199) TaxID=1263415 RepID=U1GGK1_ENDPU|nr:uncharacterized protein EPUS_07982 [Endocarpon pusillum Z07020]ERF76802.1 hypothetical protein EPUS_07982 [Endocarpon pusillum Z07020]